MFFQILEHYDHNRFFYTPFFKSFFRFSKMDIFKNVQNRKIFFQIYVKKVKKTGSQFAGLYLSCQFIILFEIFCDHIC
jgi:hypothetical protein